jgi:hypothetical protein
MGKVKGKSHKSKAVAALVAVVLGSAALDAQAPAQGGRAGGGGRGGAQGPPPTARAQAPKDFTGTWVSVVTEHWHLRMTMPPKGEYAMLPLNPQARKIADSYDPAADRAAGNECRAYGAASIMRIPSRYRISWADDNTLQMDIDSGTQTRLFRFAAAGGGGGGRGAATATDAPAPPEPTWQGTSVANWVPGRGRGLPPNGQLRVVTTRMKGGLLRKNGVPYSDNARLEEFFETFTEPNGDNWLLVTSIVTDPTYLTQPYATTYGYKKIADRAGWDPTPCRVDEPR